MRSWKGKLFVKEKFFVRLRKFRKGMVFRGSLSNCFLKNLNKKFIKELSWGKEKNNTEKVCATLRKFKSRIFLRGTLLSIFFYLKKKEFKEEKNVWQSCYPCMIVQYQTILVLNRTIFLYIWHSCQSYSE